MSMNRHLETFNFHSHRNTQVREMNHIQHTIQMRKQDPFNPNPNEKHKVLSSDKPTH